MYDARGGKSSLGDSGGMLFGVLTIAVVAIAFFGVLMWPNGDAPTTKTASVAPASDYAILTKLDDSNTKRYVRALARISPDAAETLNEDAAAAIARGADEDELAKLVHASFAEDTTAWMKPMAKVDVRYINEFLTYTKDTLRSLSSSRSKWCLASTYEDMGTKSQIEFMNAVLNGFDYGSPLYNYTIEANAILFEAAAEARDNPQSYGKVTSQDEAALQGLAMKLMMNPEIMRLSQMNAMSASQKKQSLGSINICKLGIIGVDAFASLPNGTKGRLWAEGFRQMDSGAIEKAMGQMGGF